MLLLICYFVLISNIVNFVHDYYAHTDAKKELKNDQTTQIINIFAIAQYWFKSTYFFDQISYSSITIYIMLLHLLCVSIKNALDFPYTYRLYQVRHEAQSDKWDEDWTPAICSSKILDSAGDLPILAPSSDCYDRSNIVPVHLATVHCLTRIQICCQIKINDQKKFGDQSGKIKINVRQIISIFSSTI